MKRLKGVKAGVSLCVMLGLILLVNPLRVRAAEVIATVQGTVLSGTTSDLLLLSTKDGKMEIKLDSGTDTSECKVLLPGREIGVSVAHGSDEYLHAVKITTDLQTPAGTVDSSSAVTVTGTLGKDSKDDLLYLDTAQGQMQIKLDTTTNMSSCSVLVMGKTYYITCARGSDAYMHAISISDTDTKTADVTAAFYDAAGNAVTSSVTGTVDNRTKEDLLYLSTKEGTMQFVIDGYSDTARGRVLTPDRKLTVYFYRGSDAYLHAAGTVGVKEGTASAEIDTSSTVNVTGTVRSKSDEDLLCLETDQGNMEIKLDVLNSLSNCRVLVSGRKINVTCARGSDAYMHALTVAGA